MLICYVGKFFHTESPNQEILELRGVVVNKLTGVIIKCYPRCLEDDLNVDSVENTHCSSFLNQLCFEFPAIDIVHFPNDSFCLPGFYDAHIHALSSGIRETKGIDVSLCQNWSEASEILKSRAEQLTLSQAEWLVGGGWHREWFSSDSPSSELLDSSVSSHLKVFLREKDGHQVWLNSKALGDFVSKFGEKSVRAQDVSGHEGLLFESDADNATSLLPKLSLQDKKDAILYVQKKMIGCGIVGYQEAGLTFQQVQAYKHLYNTSLDFLLSVRCLLRQTPLSFSSTAMLIEQLQDVQQTTSSRLLIDGIKLFLDGVIEEGTAALINSHEECFCRCETNLPWQDVVLQEIIRTSISSNLVQTLHLHVIGDGAVRQAVNCIEICYNQIKDCNGGCDIQLAHVQIVQDEDLERISTLKCRTVFSPLWFNEDSLATQKTLLAALGPEQYASQYPWKKLNPEYICFGSDYPVSSFHPLTIFQCALFAGMPPSLALHCMTKGAAEACGFNAGFFAEGCLADFVLLKGDPTQFFCGLEEGHGVEIASTYISGRCVFET